MAGRTTAPWRAEREDFIAFSICPMGSRKTGPGSECGYEERVCQASSISGGRVGGAVEVPEFVRDAALLSGWLHAERRYDYGQWNATLTRGSDSIVGQSPAPAGFRD